MGLRGKHTPQNISKQRPTLPTKESNQSHTKCFCRLELQTTARIAHSTQHMPPMQALCWGQRCCMQMEEMSRVMNGIALQEQQLQVQL